jgi:hypothetical protein
MKQKHLFTTGIPSIVMLSMVFILILAACPLDDDEGDKDDGLFNAPGLIDWPLPSAVGKNEVGGKAWLTSYIRVAYSSNRTYTRSVPTRGIGNEFVLDGNGKHTYTPIESGTYSWNETDKKVTYKIGKTFYTNFVTNSTGTKLLDIREYRQAMRDNIDEFKTTNPQNYAWWIKYIVGGDDKLESYINNWVNDDFSAKYSIYSLSNNGVSLLMQEVLPDNFSSDELSGYNYKSANTEYPYTFGKDGTYTFKGSDWQDQYHEITGTFAYYNGGQWDKIVYLLPSTVDGKTMVEWYDEVEVPTPHRFTDGDAYKAAETNTTFQMIEFEYNSSSRTIGR